MQLIAASSVWKTALTKNSPLRRLLNGVVRSGAEADVKRQKANMLLC